MTKVTDGQAVAKLFVDGYLNSFQMDHGEVLEIMAGQEQKIRDNLTYLGFAWLKGLSEVSCYDLRNEASKLLADDICTHIEQEPTLYQIPYSGNFEMEVDARDDAQMALLLVNYLSADSGNGYMGFVDYALRTHRTLQQNLTRFLWNGSKKQRRNPHSLKRPASSFPDIPCSLFKVQRGNR